MSYPDIEKSGYATYNPYEILTDVQESNQIRGLLYDSIKGATSKTMGKILFGGNPLMMSGGLIGGALSKMAEGQVKKDLTCFMRDIISYTCKHTDSKYFDLTTLLTFVSLESAYIVSYKNFAADLDVFDHVVNIGKGILKGIFSLSFSEGFQVMLDGMEEKKRGNYPVLHRMVLESLIVYLRHLDTYCGIDMGEMIKWLESTGFTWFYLDRVFDSSDISEFFNRYIIPPENLCLGGNSVDTIAVEIDKFAPDLLIKYKEIEPTVQTMCNQIHEIGKKLSSSRYQ